MANKNLLTGSQVSAFTPDTGASGSGPGQKFELHKYLQRVTDTRGPRVVVHEFPGRDGAKVETLGRKPHKTQWDLVFVGPDWLATLTALVKAVDASPSGMLVHPVYGQMRVVCHGLDPSVVDAAQFTDTVTLTLAFTEDQQDLGLNEQQGTAAKQQAVSSASSGLQSAAAAYADAASVSAVAGLVSSAAAFSSAAFAAAATATPDASLPRLLDGVGAALASAESALQASPLAGQSVAQVYDVLAAAEVVYSSCLDLSDEVSLETSGFFTFVVPGDVSIGVLLQGRYGSRALSVLDQVLQLNAAAILDPTAIPAGTSLTLPL